VDPNIENRFNDDILRAMMARFAIEPGSITLLDGFESFIYEYQRAGEAFILRIGHSLRRNECLIQAEVDWINYLAAGGAGVARAVVSQNGRLVEPVPDGQGESFLGTAFIKAPGAEPQRASWTPALYQTYGALLGRMHRLAKAYTPPNPTCLRPQWDDPINMYIDSMLPPDETEVLGCYLPLIAHLSSLPREPQGYGMIHQDAHGGNFFVSPEGAITLFDFDDCCYGHFAYDLAMVIFYHSLDRPRDQEFLRNFLTNFFTGYARENRLDPVWLAEIPHFAKLREIDLYAVLRHTYPGATTYDHPWTDRYMQGRKEKITACTPVIEYDWESLKEML
jgi:Ser/Thr protein kinase RdoA (MazF antagonist)